MIENKCQIVFFITMFISTILIFFAFVFGCYIGKTTTTYKMKCQERNGYISNDGVCLKEKPEEIKF
jgi:hypothetical protein